MSEQKPSSWYVAFDRVGSEPKRLCRVVHVNQDGTRIYMKHLSGVRKIFLGLE